MSDDHSVIVVGNGPIQTGYGDMIDKCDEVIRFNEFVIKGHEDRVGTKTTIWCYASNNWRGSRVFKGKTFEKIWVTKSSRAKKGMARQAEAMKAKFIKIPGKIDRKTKQRDPSTGLSAIFAAMYYYPESQIYIVGFQGSKKHYWGGQRGRTCSHNWHSEQKIILGLVQGGKIKELIPTRKTITFL